jgi:HD-like signal output (HDOD) protein
MTTAEQLLQVELPPRPAVLMELSGELDNEEPDLKRVTELVSSDVGLAASVIKTVNSPYFGLSRQVASVHQAITFLGLAEVLGIVSGALLGRAFKSSDPMMERIWDESAARGAAMRRLATQLRVVPPDRAYTCGLFENAGMALLLIQAPGYSDLAQHAADGGELIADERAHYGVDHAGLGQALMRTWGLPDELGAAVRLHHATEQLVNDGIALPVRVMVALSCIANAALLGNLSHWVNSRTTLSAVLSVPEDELQDQFEALAATATLGG